MDRTVAHLQTLFFQKDISFSFLSFSCSFSLSLFLYFYLFLSQLTKQVNSIVSKNFQFLLNVPTEFSDCFCLHFVFQHFKSVYCCLHERWLKLNVNRAILLPRNDHCYNSLGIRKIRGMIIHVCCFFGNQRKSKFILFHPNFICESCENTIIFFQNILIWKKKNKQKKKIEYFISYVSFIFIYFLFFRSYWF